MLGRFVLMIFKIEIIIYRRALVFTRNHRDEQCVVFNGSANSKFQKPYPRVLDLVASIGATTNSKTLSDMLSEVVWTASVAKKLLIADYYYHCKYRC